MTHKETVEAIYAAFQRGDISFIVSQLSPNVFWRQPASLPWGGDYNGPAEVGSFFAKLNEGVETTGFEVEENIEAAGQIISYGFYESTYRATGKPSRARFVFRWQFEGGKVSNYEALLDSAPIVAAMLP